MKAYDDDDQGSNSIKQSYFYFFLLSTYALCKILFSNEIFFCLVFFSGTWNATNDS